MSRQRWTKKLCQAGGHFKPFDDFRGKRGQICKVCVSCRQVRAQHKKCIRLEQPERHQKMLEKQRASLTTRVTVYRSAAKRRQLAWSLTDQEAFSLLRDACHYCGSPCPPGSLHGIDRVKNRDGYTVENSVTSCHQCNTMKRDWNRDSFIAICHKITRHLDTRGLFLPVDLKMSDATCVIPNVKPRHVQYHVYRRNALRRGLDFDLSWGHFQRVICQPCVFCGKESDGDHHSNGLDRRDSRVGYTVENVQACCGTCNRLKWNFDQQSFISKCTAISQNHPLPSHHLVVHLVREKRRRRRD